MILLYARLLIIRNILKCLIIVSLFMVYYDYAWYKERILPVPFGSVVFAASLAFLFVMTEILVKRTNIRLSRELGAIFLFYVVIQSSLIGLYLNDITDEKLVQYLKTNVHLLFYVIFVVIIIALFGRGRLTMPLRFYYLCGTAVAAFGILQFIHLNISRIAGFEHLLFGSQDIDQTFRRVSSIFNEPSWFAFFLLDWMAIGLGYIFLKGTIREWALFVLLVIAFFVSSSLGGYVGLGTLIVLTLLEFRNSSRKFYVILGLVLIPLFIYSFFSILFLELVGGRIRAIYDDASFQMRIDSIQAAIEVWLKNPIFGVGIGNASFYTPEYYKGFWLYLYRVGTDLHMAVDSVFFRILAENGLVGFIAFIFMYYGLVKYEKKYKFHLSGRNGPVDDETVIFTKIFRIIVLVNFAGFIVSGSLLDPRIWFNIAFFLSFKRAVADRIRTSNGLKTTGLNSMRQSRI